MKERLVVQVTYETEIEVEIPDEVNTEDFLYHKGVEISNSQHDMNTTVFIDTGSGVRSEMLDWGVTRAEFISDDGFVGEYWY